MINFKKIAENLKDFLKNKSKKEMILFSKSRFSFSVRPFLFAQGAIIFAVVLLVLFSFASIFLFKPKIAESQVIKSAAVKKNSVIIANGQPVQWTAVVKRNSITNIQKFIKLPKNAKNIKISSITAKQANEILSSPPKEQLSLLQRQAIAVTTQKISNKGVFARISKFLFADLEQAASEVAQSIVEQIVPPVENEPPTVEMSDAIAVDLSFEKSEAKDEKQEAEQEQKEEQKQEKEEKQQDKQGENLTSNDAIAPTDVSQTPAEGQPAEEVGVSPELTPTSPEEPTEVGPLETETPAAPDVDETPPIVNEQDKQDKQDKQDEKPSEPKEETPKEQLQEEPEQLQEEQQELPQEEYVAVTYETPAPTITEKETDTGKLITVSAQETENQPPLVDVIASSKIPRLFKTGEESKIQIKWKNNNDKPMAFKAYDTDNDNYLDYVEWTVPHLSEQIFQIIFISKAFLLDESQNILADIYEQVKTKDNTWAQVANGQYVRYTFEQPLDSARDNTIYAKPASDSQTATIEVYPVYTDADGNQTEGPLVATFLSIDREDTYKVLLTNLQTSTDVFDMKISGSVEIDFIVDPTPAGAPSVTEPANSSSVGNLQTIIGTPNATTQSTSTIFNYLRKLEQDRLNTAAGAVAEASTDAGKLQDLLGASAAAQDRATIFDYIHKLYNDLVNLVAGNIKTGTTIGGLTGTYVGYPGTGWSGTTITQSACDAQNASGWYWFADGNGDGDTTDAEDGVCVKSTTVTSTSWNGSEQMGTTAITAQAATGGSSNTIIKDSAGWTADAYINMVADITAGTAAGCWGIVKTNTSDTITVWGSWLSSAYASNCGTPDATSVFSVEDDGFTLYDNSWIGDWTCDGTAFPNGAPSWGSFPTSAKAGSAVIALATADCYDGTRDLLATEASRAVKTGTATAADATTITDTALSLNTNEYIGQKVLITAGTGANGYGRIESNTGTVITVDSWTGGSPGVGSAFSIIYVIPHATYNPNTDVDGNDDTELRGNNGPLTQEVLNNWKGTRLPTASDFFGFCGYNSTDGSGDGSYENTTGTYTADKTYGNYGGQIGRTDEFLDLANSGSWEWLSEQHYVNSARIAGSYACSYFNSGSVNGGYRFRAVFRP